MSTFTPLSTLLAVQAMRGVAGSAWPVAVRLRALQTSFIGPVGQGLAEVEVVGT